MMLPPPTRVVSLPVHPLDYDRATDILLEDMRAGRGGYVCIANVHMAMEAWDDAAFQRVVDEARMVTSDGMPLVWMLRLLGRKTARRVYGPTLTLHLCEAAAAEGLPIALYGGTEESLEQFQSVLSERFPGLVVACAIAPPFRPLTEEEDAHYTRCLKDSGARLVLVGIGCPRQEKWMAAHRDRLPGATLVGVGAAFDFHSGRVRQAPAALQAVGLEWAFRLVMEPRRLWRRYAVHNPRFVGLAIRQLLGLGVPRAESSQAPPTPSILGQPVRRARRNPSWPSRSTQATRSQSESFGTDPAD